MRVENYIVFAGLLSSAIFFFYFILFRRIEPKGRIYIISSTLIVFYTFLYDFLILNNCYKYAVYFFPFYFPLIFSLYPLIYHYLVNAVDDKNQRFIVKVFSYVPSLVLIITIAIYSSINYTEKIHFIKTDITQFNTGFFPFELYQLIIFILYYFQLIVFVIVFIQMYLAHKKRKRDVSVTPKPFLPRWLFSFVSIIILYEVIYTIFMFFEPNYQSQLINLISNVAVVLFIGFLGIQHDEMLLMMKLNPSINKTVKFNKESIDEAKAEQVMKSIYVLMDGKKLYRNPSLKLEHLAKKIHLPQKTLSEIINKYEGENFSQFINKYRIKEAKQILSDKNHHHKIHKIYSSLGFYSRSTFNRSFKTIEGITPTEFINSIS